MAIPIAVLIQEKRKTSSRVMRGVARKEWDRTVSAKVTREMSSTFGSWDDRDHAAAKRRKRAVNLTDL